MGNLTKPGPQRRTTLACGDDDDEGDRRAKLNTWSSLGPIRAMEQPTKMELWINLTTAKALGIDIPFQLEQLADRVIE